MCVPNESQRVHEESYESADLTPSIPLDLDLAFILREKEREREKDFIIDRFSIAFSP